MIPAPFLAAIRGKGGTFTLEAMPNIRLIIDPILSSNNLVNGGTVTGLTNVLVSPTFSFTGTGIYRTTGINGQPAIETNGVLFGGNGFTSAGGQLMNSLITTTEFYIGAVIQATTITTNDSGYLSNQNVIATHGLKLAGRNNGPTMNASVYGNIGPGDAQHATAAPITLTTPTLFTMRFKSGLLYIGKNGVETAGVAAAVQAGEIAQLVIIMTDESPFSTPWHGQVGLIWVANGDPGVAYRTGIEAAMMSRFGLP